MEPRCLARFPPSRRKTRASNANDAARAAGDHYRAIKNVEIAAELPLPERIAEDGSKPAT